MVHQGLVARRNVNYLSSFQLVVCGHIESTFSSPLSAAMLRVGARICARAAFAQPPAAGVARTMATHTAAPTSMRGVLAAGAVAVGGVAAWTLYERKQVQVRLSFQHGLLFMPSPLWSRHRGSSSLRTPCPSRIIMYRVPVSPSHESLSIG